jgi:hypothetical protein
MDDDDFVNNAFKKTSKPKRRSESFAELKKAVDEGYERFWSKPHRIKLRPQVIPFGYLDFSGDGEDEKRDSSDLT